MTKTDSSFDKDSLQRLITLPADPELTDGTYQGLLTARRLLNSARELAEVPGLDGEALMLSTLAVLEHVPHDPDALALLARAYETLGHPREALGAYRQALAAHPPFAPDRDTIAAAIERLRVGAQADE